MNDAAALAAADIGVAMGAQGWLVLDEQRDHLDLAMDDEEGATLQQLQGHSITYRIAMGPQAGRKVLSVY